MELVCITSSLSFTETTDDYDYYLRESIFYRVPRYVNSRHFQMGFKTAL